MDLLKEASINHAASSQSLPASDAPFSTFRGYLKQIDTNRLDQRTREYLTKCFPEFQDLDRAAHWTQNAGVGVAMGSTHATRRSRGRARRYSGGADLPGGRYFAICNNDSGYDGGTLVRELMSYWSSRTRAMPELVDSTVDVTVAEQLREHPMLGSAPFLMLLVREIQTTASAPPYELGPAAAVVMPLPITPVDYARVLDLRRREAQDWLLDFCNTHVSGHRDIDIEGTVLRTWKPRLSSFRELLPTLMSPTVGGSVFHDSLGVWLRRHGCFGLVFPSARRNARVHCDDQEITGFDGWNFVVYDGAPRPEQEPMFGVEPKWLTEYDAGIRVEDWCDLPRRWSVTGAEEGEERRYQNESMALVRGTRNISVVRHPRFGTREPRSPRRLDATPTAGRSPDAKARTETVIPQGAAEATFTVRRWWQIGKQVPGGYELRCTKCDARNVFFRRDDGQPWEQCPACGFADQTIPS